MPADECTHAEELTIAELMTAEVVGVDEETTLQEAVRLMVSRGIRHLPVRRGDQVVAVLSDRDVRLMVSDRVDPQERRRYMATTGVMQHASSPVITVRPDASVADAARIFVESRIGCLPVVEADDRLVGIVTQTDLLKWIGQVTD